MENTTVGFIEKVNEIYSKLNAIVEASTIFDADIVERLEDLSELDIAELTDDLKKQTYLGNRKTDIDLAFNIQGIEESTSYEDTLAIWNENAPNVRYNKAKIFFVDGHTVEIDLKDDDGNILSATSHAGVYQGLTHFTTVDPVKQVMTFREIVALDSTLYRVTINDINFDYTSDTDATTPEIISGIVQEINVTQTNGAVEVTTNITENGTAFTLTANTAGVSFDVGSNGNMSISTVTQNIVGGSVQNEFMSYLKDTVLSQPASSGKATDTIIRFYDVLGSSSNLERIQLYAESGTTYKESQPEYYWSKTTSALETLAMRAGDVIKLGNEIDNLILLSDSITPLLELQSRIPQLVDEYDANGNAEGDVTIYNKLAELNILYENVQELLSIYSKLTEIKNVNDNIDAVVNVSNDLDLGMESNIKKTGENIDNINAVAEIEESVTNVSDMDNELLAIEAKLPEIITTYNNLLKIIQSSDNAISAEESKNTALEYLQQITELTASAIQLTSSQDPTVTYNSATGKLIIGIPQGLKGDRGEAFNVDASGAIAERTAYDGASQGFAYLSLDEDPTLVYFKKSDTSGDWSVGVPFGKGDKGDKGDAGNGIQDIIKTGTTGLVDTYTISYTDSTTSTYTVKNAKSISSTSFISTTDESGLAGKNGATDTYRITFNDSTQFEFSIHNGIDSSVLSVAGKTGDITLEESDIENLDKYTQEETDNLLEDKADKDTTYTKTEVDNEITSLDIDSTLATLTKSFTENEEIEIPLSKEVLVPNVSVTKEIPQLGLTNNIWGVDDDYEQESDLLDISNAIVLSREGNILSDTVPFHGSTFISNSSTNGTYTVILEGSEYDTVVRVEDMWGNFIRYIPVTGFTNQIELCVFITSLGQIVVAGSYPNSVNSAKYIVFSTSGTVLKSLTAIASSGSLYRFNMAEATDGRVIISYMGLAPNRLYYYILSSSLSILKSSSILVSDIDILSTANSARGWVVGFSNNTFGVLYSGTTGTLYLANISASNSATTTVNISASRANSSVFASTSNDNNLVILYQSDIGTIRGTIVSSAGTVILSDRDVIIPSDIAQPAIGLGGRTRLSINQVGDNYLVVLSDQYGDYNVYPFVIDSTLSIIETLPSRVSPSPSSETSYGASYYSVSSNGTTIDRYYNTMLVKSTGTYVPSITNLSGQIDSIYWSDIRDLLMDETLNSQEINYAISTDNKTTFQIAKTIEGFRSIVKFDTVWKYNSDTTYENETWTEATINNIYQALSEAMTLEANKMPKTQINALLDTEYFILGNTLDLAAILYTDDDTATPIFNGASINYEANVLNQPAIVGTDYTWEWQAPEQTNVRFTALTNNNLKIRIS